MSRKALSVTEAKATLSERSREVERGEPVLRVVEPQGGLASIAGGWGRARTSWWRSSRTRAAPSGARTWS